MKPRIFISSTCYDLKFVREDLADFVREYDYEPILSENGDIGYIPGQNLDKSCYVAMQTSDMVILIIGSEYGSAASGETKDEFTEYISITRNEYRTAIEAGIPVFAMIDKKVMAEYGIYEENIEKIEKNGLEIKFKITKDLNVFRFIKEIKNSTTIPIQEFEKSADIKGFISKQWADMFKNYLTSLRNEKEDKKIENTVNEMKALIQKMSIMLDSVGKNVLSKEGPEEYENVVNQQEILEFCDMISDGFEMKIKNESSVKDADARKRIVTEFLNILKETHEKNLWVDFESKDTEKIMKFFGIFDKEEFSIESIIAIYLQKVGNMYKLLYDNSNITKMADIMISDKYFYKLTNV